MTETKTEKSVVDRYLEVVDLVVEESLQIATQKLNAQFDGIINTKLIEVGEITNAALGVKNKALLVTPSTLRKAMLEQSESGRKTPVAVEKAGPEGTKPQNPIDKMYDEFEGGKR